jgi:hypothetical protein
LKEIVFELTQRCNVLKQIIDAGEGYLGDGPEAKPTGHAKHVVLRVDRGDGFVGRNFLMRGGLEFGFYTEETDGVLLDRTKFYWNADYGHLSFTSDHHLVNTSHGVGTRDALTSPETRTRYQSTITVAQGRAAKTTLRAMPDLIAAPSLAGAVFRVSRRRLEIAASDIVSSWAFGC